MALDLSLPNSQTTNKQISRFRSFRSWFAHLELRCCGWRMERMERVAQARWPRQTGCGFSCKVVLRPRLDVCEHTHAHSFWDEAQRIVQTGVRRAAFKYPPPFVVSPSMPWTGTLSPVWTVTSSPGPPLHGVFWRAGLGYWPRALSSTPSWGDGETAEHFGCFFTFCRLWRAASGSSTTATFQPTSRHTETESYRRFLKETAQKNTKSNLRNCGVRHFEAFAFPGKVSINPNASMNNVWYLSPQ